MNIYVGNLSYRVTDDELRNAFAAFGQVESAKIITDKFSNQSKGFAFVEMPVQAEAEKAIKELNGSMLSGRNITVNVARPKTDDRPRRPKRF